MSSPAAGDAFTIEELQTLRPQWQITPDHLQAMTRAQLEMQRQQMRALHERVSLAPDNPP
jgi:hypothetical protein